MARPRGFDEATVLDAAIGRFWADGYAATSVRELGAAMGLGPASLYNCFGDKRTLFVRALDRYLDVSMRARIKRLERELPPRAAIAAFLTDIVALSLGDRRGCLLVNTAVELAAHDSEIGAVVAARLGELEAFFRRAIGAGRRDGTIAATTEPVGLARLFVATVIGLRVLARARPDPDLLRDIADQALAVLDPPAPERPQ